MRPALGWLLALALLPHALAAQPVAFSAPAGAFTRPFDLVLTSVPEGLAVRYTLDGSLPDTAPTPTNAATRIYTGPIRVETTRIVRARAMGNSPETLPVATRSFLHLNTLLNQPTNPPGFPATWRSGKADYAMDPRVVLHPDYLDSFPSQLTSLPWISLVADPVDLFLPRGIYANPLQEGADWERPVSVELIGWPAGGDGHVQSDAGVQILGEISRIEENKKHSLRLSFKTRYGNSKLDYPVFPDSPVSIFDRIDLLGGSVDSVPLNFVEPGLSPPLYLRDGFLKQSQIDMGRPGVHKLHAHLFLNGLYWGLYGVSERPDSGYASEYFGGKKGDYDVLKHLDFATLEVVSGDRTAWDAMVAVASKGLADPGRYAEIQAFLNIDEFIDYLLVNMHLGNGDWPQKNWYALRKRAAGEPFHFFCWDGDGVLGLFGITLNKTGFATPNTPAFLYSKLRENTEFRLRFGDRIQLHVLNADGALTVVSNQARLLRLAASMESGMPGESARWGDSFYRRPGKDLFLPDAHWTPELQRVRDQVIPQRHDISMRHFREAGLHPDVGAPNLDTSALASQGRLEMTHTNPAAILHFTLDGSDPRLAGGAVAEGAIPYSGPLPLALPTLLTARARTPEGWSARVQQRLVPGPPPRIQGVERVGHAARVTFATRPGFVYDLLRTTRLEVPDWQVAATLAASPSPGVAVLEDPGADDARRFYRILAR